MFLMDDVFRSFKQDGLHEIANRLFGDLEFLDLVSYISLSRTLWSEVTTTLRRDPPDVVIIPGWRDPTLDYAAMPPPTVDDNDAVRFVFASRLGSHKGPELVVVAAVELLKAGHTNFVIDMYGAGEIAALHQIIVALGVNEYVRYRGVLPKTEMTRRMADYDAFLFPTWEREPFGFVVPEAAAAGCIPVMTAGIGAAEWFSDGIDCFKIRRDIAGLTGAMLKVMDMAPRDREAMRRCCRETGLRLFSFDEALRVVETELYRAAANTHLPGPTAIRGTEAALALLDSMLALTETA